MNKILILSFILIVSINDFVQGLDNSSSVSVTATPASTPSNRRSRSNSASFSSTITSTPMIGYCVNCELLECLIFELNCVLVGGHPTLDNGVACCNLRNVGQALAKQVYYDWDSHRRYERNNLLTQLCARLGGTVYSVNRPLGQYRHYCLN